MIAVNGYNVPEKYQDFAKYITTSDSPNNSAFVQVEILEPLRLGCRGSKKAVLIETKCKILNLNMEVSSINTAYTWISERFEPNRRSHTGNVFTKCYYQREFEWFPLEDLREAAEADFEEQLFLDYKVFTLNPSCDETIMFNDEEKLLIENFDNQGQITGEKIKKIFNNNRGLYLHVIWSLTDKEVIEEINAV